MSKKPVNLTARSIAYLEAQGYVVDECERRITRTLKRDLFGVFDLIAIRVKDARTVGVQVTTGDNHAARRKKIIDSDIIKQWLDCHNRILVLSWRPPCPSRDGWLAREEWIHQH